MENGPTEEKKGHRGPKVRLRKKLSSARKFRLSKRNSVAVDTSQIGFSPLREFPSPLRSPRVSHPDGFPDQERDNVLHLNLAAPSPRDSQGLSSLCSPRFRAQKRTSDSYTAPVVTLHALRNPDVIAELGQAFYGLDCFADLHHSDVERFIPKRKRPRSIPSALLHSEPLNSPERSPATHFSDSRRKELQSHREKILADVDSKIKALISAGRRQKVLAAVKHRELLSSHSEFFLATLSGPSHLEMTRTYKERLAATSISTYPTLGELGRAGDPICDFYFTRIFGLATIVALADGCNWGERPKAAAIAAGTSFVRYLQDRLHLFRSTKTLAESIVNAFSAAHQAISEGYINPWEAGTATLLGGALIPIRDDDTIPEFYTSVLGDQSQLASVQPRLQDDKYTSSVPSVERRRQSRKSSPRVSRQKTTPVGDLSRHPDPEPSFAHQLFKPATPERTTKRKRTFSDTWKTRLDSSTSSSSTEEKSEKEKSEREPQPTVRKNFLLRNPGLASSTTQQQRRSSMRYPSKGIVQKKERWAFVYGNVGDCKAYVYSWKKKTVRDITRMNRQTCLSANDCGGRLGPYTRDGAPDMRNFRVSYCSLYTEDLLIMVTDGIHDNLDPELLGKTPRECQLDVDEWDQANLNDIRRAKINFQEAKLAELIEKSKRTPQSVCDTLAEYCRELTKPGRLFMEAHPEQELPEDYVAYPGKMDHTSVICLKIDSPGLACAQLLRHAFMKKETAVTSSPDQITTSDLDRSTFRPEPIANRPR